MSDERNDLSEHELQDLSRWGADWNAPASLKGETVRALERHGRLGRVVPLRRASRVQVAAWTATAAAFAFVVGLGVGGRRPQAIAPPAIAPPAERYMLLLYETPAYRGANTESEEKARVSEYGSWAHGLYSHGRYVDGDELAQSGARYHMSDGELATISPAHSGDGVLAGYFVIGAKSQDEAVAVMRDCPHLKYGGEVELRRIATH